MIVKQLCLVEIEVTPEEGKDIRELARAKLDAFRESVQPSAEYGVTIDQARGDNLHNYALNVDGPLLADQRRLLLKILATVHRGKPNIAGSPQDEELLQGLMSLLDEIADQAHDRHGIESLIEEQPPR